MLKNAGGYKTALALTLALAVTEAAFLLYSATFKLGTAGPAIRVSVALLVAAGLWLYIGFARYLGAVWFAASVAMFAWAAATNTRAAVGFPLYWTLAVSVLSVATVYVLLVSRQFASEFTALQATRPRYKKTLVLLLTGALVLAAIAATANDIYQLSR